MTRRDAMYSVGEFAVEWYECVPRIPFPSSEMLPIVMRFGSGLVYDAICNGYRECAIGRILNANELVIYVRGFCEASSSTNRSQWRAQGGHGG